MKIRPIGPISHILGDSLSGQGAVRILALPTFRRTRRTRRTSRTYVFRFQRSGFLSAQSADLVDFSFNNGSYFFDLIGPLCRDPDQGHSYRFEYFVFECVRFFLFFRIMAPIIKLDSVISITIFWIVYDEIHMSAFDSCPECFSFGTIFDCGDIFQSAFTADFSVLQGLSISEHGKNSIPHCSAVFSFLRGAVQHHFPCFSTLSTKLK